MFNVSWKIMSKYCTCLFSLLFFVFGGVSGQNKSDIVLENTRFKLTIGSNAVPKSLILKSNHEECLKPDPSVSMFSATQERPYNNEVKLAHLNKKTTYQADTLFQKDGKLMVGFEIIPYSMVINYAITEDYIRFSLEDFVIPGDAYPSYMKITPPPATEIALLQLPVKERTNFGEWLNVMWDNKVAVNVLATDEFTQIDSERRDGYHILQASAVKDIQLKGTGAALIVCESDELLDHVAQIEHDFDLPRGVEMRRGDRINASYFHTFNINPKNVDEQIALAKRGGFRCILIYYPAFLAGGGGLNYLGDYEWNTKAYPNRREDMVEVLQKIRNAGITPGFHFLHSQVGLKSKYITPIPDHRLNLVRHFNLSKDLKTTDTEVYVEQNPQGSTMAEGCRILKVGTELISYEQYSTVPPYKFTGCKRAVHNTTLYSADKGTPAGILDVSEYMASSVYINQDNSLQDEIAEKIGDIYNAGFQFVYMDGSEGVNPPFNYNVPLAQYKVIKHFNHEPLFAEGAAKSHFSWHILSGANAFDAFPPEQQKDAVRKYQMEQAPRMKKDFTRINFGWIYYRLPDQRSIGTQPDILEFVTSKAAAWDCPIAMGQLTPDVVKTHLLASDNLEVLRRWEDVRARNWLTEKQKKLLQHPNQEFTLIINEEDKYELIPYEQIEHISNQSKEVRAFIFNRNKEWYVTYWHISEDKLLELPVKDARISIFKDFRLKSNESIIESDHSVLLPVGERRYLKMEGKTKKQILEIFRLSRVVDKVNPNV